MACADENELIEYADGLLLAEPAAAVAEHLVGCSSCRAVLAGLAKGEAVSAGPGPVPSPARPPPGLPAQLLRDYLAAEAPRRENSSASVAIVVSVAALVIDLAGSGDWSARRLLIIAMSLLLAWSLFVKLAIRRDRFHPAMSWVSALFETTIPGAVLMIFGLLQQPEAPFRSPAQMVWSMLVMAGALRVRPLLSLVGGAVAAAECTAMWLYLSPHFTQPGPELSCRLQVMRAGFLLISGFGAAAVATVMVRSAERALQAVREQDLMGKYVLHEQLGKGGMAEVFRATYCPEGGFQKTVAVKRVLPGLSERPRFAQMFLEEARLCAMLVHPNVVQVHDCGRFRDTFILAMEFIDGAPLSRLIAGRALPFAAVTYVGAELAKALDYIHHKRAPDGTPLRLVHRDLNPPNVLISRLGEVKLADFGVAFAASRERVGERDGFYGKVAYSSPEQRALRALDGRSDLYLLGLTLKDMLTSAPGGALPDSVPVALRTVVSRLLEERPERRPACAADVHAELSQLRGELAPYPSGASLLAQAVGAAPSLPPTSQSVSGTTTLALRKRTG